jgi:hypothetical protein
MGKTLETKTPEEILEERRGMRPTKRQLVEKMGAEPIPHMSGYYTLEFNGNKEVWAHLGKDEYYLRHPSVTR